MRLKSDSCFSFHSNRVGSLWKKGIPPARQGSQLLSLSDFTIKNSNKQFIKFSFLYVQDKYLVADQNYINLENLLYKKTYMRLSTNHKECMKSIVLSNNIDSIEINGPVLLVDEFFKSIKLQVIQDDFNQQYEIIKLLGKGSFAKVFKVKQSNKIQFFKDKKILAAKIFNKRKMRENQEENEMSLWKEIEIMRMLNHKNIIKLHEVFEDGNKVYLILDLLEGGELISNFDDQKQMYDEQLVMKLMKNILDALCYIHNLQIIHRDIKPENIILKQKNDLSNIVLADFGLADIYNVNGEYLFQRCGSIGYVAPELIQNESYDYKVDVFSLGVIFYFFLTGEQAFQGSETKVVLENNLNCNIDMQKLENAKVSKEAKDLCRKMLQKNQQLRISSQEALEHAWFYVDQSRIKKNTLKINKKPTIIRQNKDLIHSNTPLWVNKSLQSITDSSDNIGSNNINVRDKTIQQILDDELELDKFQLNSSLYDLDDDYIQEDSTPFQKIQNHQLLVKKRSLP